MPTQSHAMNGKDCVAEKWRIVIPLLDFYCHSRASVPQGKRRHGNLLLGIIGSSPIMTFMNGSKYDSNYS